MGWEKDRLHYTYAPGTLRRIADCYCSLYNRELVRLAELFLPKASLFIIAEYKADFDISLSAIGKGHWSGIVDSDFRAYRYFGRMQQVVIADILGITDNELGGLGFYRIPRLRGLAYRWMANFLNGLPYGQSYIARW